LGHPATPTDLRNLANRYAVVTMQVDGIPSTPFTMRTVDWQPPSEVDLLKARRIKEIARRRGKSVKEVAKEIRDRFRSIEAEQESSVSLRELFSDRSI